MTPEQQAAIRDAVAQQMYERDFWGASAPKWSAMSEQARDPFRTRASETIAAHLKALEAAGIVPVDDRIDELEEALRRIVQWADAYPLDIFPEPDFARAAHLLREGGVTLDSISASILRRAIAGVGKIAREALDERIAARPR